MYCSKCGSQIPDGAVFCPKCGAAQNSSQQAGPPPGQNPGYQSGQAPPYRQPNAPQPGSAGGVGINTWPMVIDILYGVQILLMIIMAANPFSFFVVNLLDVIVGIALLVIIILDLVYLSNIGIRGGWKWSILIMPLYLFLRAAKTDHDNKWAIINLIEFVVLIILSFSIQAMVVAAFMSTIY